MKSVPEAEQIPNAGVAEIGRMTQLEVKDGKPQPPNLKTFDIDLTAVLYSAPLRSPLPFDVDCEGWIATSLAFHHLGNANTSKLRAVVLMGSIGR